MNAKMTATISDSSGVVEVRSPVVEQIVDEEVYNDGDSNPAEANDDDDDDSRSSSSSHVIGVTESELLYSIESFGAVFLPVSITMTLSALAVVFINTPESVEAGEAAYASVYQVFDVDAQTQTTAQNLGASVANTLIIVTAIGVMTFVVVLLYKYKCLKILYGYLILATTMLLGYFTSSMLVMFIRIYGWFGRGMDKLSFAVIMYNYAAVGVLSIFYGRGVPKWVSQGYLIGSSVCVAWQLSYFQDWMAWTLLVMLAFYDLFAVLSPCGPLKMLAEQISRQGAPSLPGLLYEASLPAGVSRPKRKNQSEDETATAAVTTAAAAAASDERQPASSDDDNHSRNKNQPFEDTNECRTSSLPLSTTAVTTRDDGDINDRQIENQGLLINNFQHKVYIDGVPSDIDTSNSTKVPLALAKMYRLSVIDETGVLKESCFASSWQRYYTADEIRGTTEGESVCWTSKQLRSEVTAIMPPRGGRIEKCPSEEQKYEEGAAYYVFNRHSDVQRKLVVTNDGQVMEVLKRNVNDGGSERSDYGGDDDVPGSIKLGLGDFIFYSVLVSKAAQHSFTAFAACFLMVLFGLSMTLIILAMYGKALPALPISILLGVVAFLWCRWSVEPYIFSIVEHNYYL